MASVRTTLPERPAFIGDHVFPASVDFETPSELAYIVDGFCGSMISASTSPPSVRTFGVHVAPRSTDTATKAPLSPAYTRPAFTGSTATDLTNALAIPLPALTKVAPPSELLSTPMSSVPTKRVLGSGASATAFTLRGARDVQVAPLSVEHAMLRPVPTYTVEGGRESIVTIVTGPSCPESAGDQVAHPSRERYRPWGGCRSEGCKPA